VKKMRTRGGGNVGLSKVRAATTTTRMRATTLLRTVLGLKQTRVTGVRFGPTGVEVGVAPTTRVPFCSGCMRRVRRLYDRRRREWRHLDVGGMEATLVYDQRRVDCPRCGVRVELVPWAEHGSRFTRDFEDQVAYVAQVMDQTTVCKTMRIAWTTVGEIVERVVARLGPADRLEGLEYIGIDELSYRRHHEYITTVVDHVARKVVWAAPGKSAATVDEFFKALGPLRATRLKTVTIEEDANRSGRPSGVPLAIRCQLVRLACERPNHEVMRFRDVWTYASLADVLEAKTGYRLSVSEVGRILRFKEIRPHHIRQWLHSEDPEFLPKAEAVCDLYLNPPPGAIVVCVDEKPMQALERRHPTHVHAPDGTERYEYEYKRHGTHLRWSTSWRNWPGATRPSTCTWSGTTSMCTTTARTTAGRSSTPATRDASISSTPLGMPRG
jgi:hypothetical protein